MDTTFGQDNPRVNVISGGVGGGPVSTKTFDRSNSVAALEAFLASRRRARDNSARADGFFRRLGPPASVPRPWTEPPPPGGDWPESVPSPAQCKAARFRPGTEQAVATPPPVRAGRAIELD